MSIDRPKRGHDPREYWHRRTDGVLRDGPGGRLWRRDVSGVNEKVLRWLVAGLSDVADCLGRKPDVVEVGCGFGRWATALSGAYRSFVGVDVVAERVKFASEHGPGTFHCFDPGAAWPVDIQADVVMFVTVLQHLSMAVAARILTEAAKHVRPGGRIMMAEGRFIAGTRADADALYARDSNEVHMIPKPIGELLAALPAGSAWSGAGGRHVVELP